MEPPSESSGDANNGLQRLVEIGQPVDIGLASQICLKVHEILNEARRRISSGTKVQSSNHSKRIGNEAERFALWIDGFSVSSGQLDDILDNSKELRIAVYPLLYELGKTVYHGSIESKMLSLGNRESSLKLEKLRTLLSELSSTSELAVDHSDDGSSEDGRSIASDAQDILDDVAFFVDSLMDLSPALESPILDLGLKEPVTPAEHGLQAPSSFAETYSANPNTRQSDSGHGSREVPSSAFCFSAMHLKFGCFMAFIALVSGAATQKKEQFECGNEEPSVEHMEISKVLAQQEALESSNGTLRLAASTITVETYFHVVASSRSVAGGWLTERMLSEQLDVMRENFEPHGISFDLIQTTRTVNTKWSRNGDATAMKRSLRQGSYRALNLYFLQDLPSVYGRCTLPENVRLGSRAFVDDGCTIRSTTLPGGSETGSNYGKTTVHEIGHWLGLYHTFNGNSCTGSGDYVSDTPAQASASMGCPTGRDSCPGQRGLDPIRNHMDYSSHASRSRLISPDYTDPGSNAARPDQAYPSVESAESQENCQPSASYTFNISLARTHLRAQGIAMTDSDKQGSSLSTDPTRPSSPSIHTPLEFGVGSVDPLWLIDEKEAIRLCDLYEAEIGIQYPFLNMTKLVDNVRTLYRAMATGSQNGFAFTAMPGPTVIDPLDLDLIKMVISAGSVVEAGGSSQLGKALFLGVRKASHDKLWEPAGIKNTMLFVLLAIYSFMTGDDLQAWRLVGISARWCLEIGLHQSATVNRLFREEEQQKVALRLFWCVYTLDRRWGFGAGLPFVMHHCDVDRNLPEPDDAVPYLKAMVAYSQIGNKVWSTSYNSARTTGAVRDDEISYLLYLIDRWYEELPESLRLSQDWESREWTQATRVPQRLQLLLHLRTNQMKILLLQPILHSPSSLKANKSKVQSLIRFAKDTIRKLHSLNKSTDIYQTQQMCFNHFLVSALGVIFLVVALAPSEYGSTVRDEFHVALDLIRGLSAKSYVSIGGGPRDSRSAQFGRNTSTVLEQRRSFAARCITDE
ncbi:fungal specific transcription factor domain-containing protein [Colletotrichum karsti]|uniref:Fungal specific transcription factor domain-containing protein n=1 Tax=Colletotrichum karsti TaxID=1095194 RepID=A0A9P6IFL8_9PEZI|nr:fungal specific transcription factor domain-containing protein [Colletotrichum karsti]KAF9879651.1 fungal specific transcription factor domain-containing protein [Colletotrichum karsti]